MTGCGSGVECSLSMQKASVPSLVLEVKKFSSGTNGQSNLEGFHVRYSN